MQDIIATICYLAVELYKQVNHQSEDGEDTENVNIYADSKDGYSYKVTISREETAEGGDN